MARIRSIKPSFWDSVSIGNLSITARLLFIALWTHADDEGRSVYDARLLKARVFAFNDDITPVNVDKWIREIEKAGLIRLYENGVRRYLQVTNWKEHQKIDRPQPSTIPSEGSLNGQGELDEDSTNDQRGLVGGREGIGGDRKGLEGTLMSSKAARRTAALEVLEYLNQQAGRHYKPTKSHTTMIEARLKDHSLQDLRDVIDSKVEEWGKNEKMEPYLRPQTLFNAKNCDGYVGVFKPIVGGKK